MNPIRFGPLLRPIWEVPMASPFIYARIAATFRIKTFDGLSN
jgi:hypothetical protein